MSAGDVIIMTSQITFTCSNIKKKRYKLCSKLTIKTPERRASVKSKKILFSHVEKFILFSDLNKFILLHRIEWLPSIQSSLLDLHYLVDCCW